jgi:hypothetical protein
MVSGGKTNRERATSPQTHQNRFKSFFFGAFKSLPTPGRGSQFKLTVPLLSVQNGLFAAFSIGDLDPCFGSLDRCVLNPRSAAAAEALHWSMADSHASILQCLMN